jgi:hypothetical protein
MSLVPWKLSCSNNIKGHPFCEECFERLAGDVRQITCGLCRRLQEKEEFVEGNPANNGVLRYRWVRKKIRARDLGKGVRCTRRARARARNCQGPRAVIVV